MSGERSREAAAELPGLLADHPLSETLAGLLMLALHRSGQRADALAVFRATRRRLTGELGVEPGPGLQQLHQQILAGDPGLSGQPQTPQRDAAQLPAGGKQPATVSSARLAGNIRRLTAAAPAVPGVPRQLPAAVRHFAGRAAELNALTALLEGTRSGSTVVISAIGGTAGVGKTALAIHWAHSAASQFPDGQLYVNLRGFGPSQDPVEPDEAVRGFLDALGVQPDRIPASPEAQAGLYRSMLAGKHMLIVLDNARDEDQVRPLLPGSPACVVVATSRAQLAGLVAAEGAQPVTLDVLTDAEARELLARRLGEQRVAAEPDAVIELTGLCGRLPLALAVTAARAAAHPGFPLAALAAELHDKHTRLDALTGEDPATSVRAVFSWSYEHLGDRAARMFRLLGLHPGADLTAYAAASLTTLPLEDTRGLLRELARAHLLAEPAPGRYAVHDLLRAYAAEQCHMLDCQDDRRAALTCLFDYYLAAAAAAMDTLAPAERHRRPEIPPPATPLPPLGRPDAARAWLDGERANLVAVAGHTATHGWPTHTIRLAAILFRYYLDIGGNFSDALAVHTHALHAAQQTGDRTAQADALNRRAAVADRQGRHQQAARELRQALAIYRELGDCRGQARSLGNLGIVLSGQAQYRWSADHLRQALALHRELGDQFGQVIQLDNLGIVLCRQGRYKEAADHHQQALALSRQLGERHSEALALDNFGVVLSRQGRYQKAAGRHEQALAIFREIGDRNGEAEALNNLGAVLRNQGRYESAVRYHQQALAMFRELGNRPGEAEALNGAGEALNAFGRPGQARVQHHDALTLSSQIGDPHREAHSHNGLACTYYATGDLDQARQHWERALALYADLGVPEAEQVRAKLESLGTATPKPSNRARPPP